jgi:hypothetical protein
MVVPPVMRGPAIAALVAAAVLWIEHGNRIDSETPVSAANAASAGTVCPGSENVPYSADCIAFMQGDVGSGVGVSLRRPAMSLLATPTPAIASADSSGAPCPSNENVPYNENCIRFLSGWFWQP